MSAPKAPTWLQRALKEREYFDYVLGILDDRERKRELARSATRHNRKPSRQSRLLSAVFSTPRTPESHTEHYRVEVGSRPENKNENRYLALEPFDRTRVIVDEGRYLNANWVRELHGGQWWIATQAPLPNTAHAFLSLFMQPETRPPHHLAPPHPSSPGPCRIRTAVQLTVATEGGRTKAHPYFPTEIGQSYVVPPPEDSTLPALKITLEGQRTEESSRCVQSTIRLVRCSVPTGEPDTLGWNKVDEIGDAVCFTHLLFTHWPDFGVPEGPEEKASLLAFTRLVVSVNLAPPFLSSDTAHHPDPPITVNCSAGIGRTGSFIALTSLLRSHGLLIPDYRQTSTNEFPSLPPSPQGPLPDELKEDEVALEVDSLREQRTSMVQRPEQQLLIYELLAAAYYEVEARGS
ncbi:protein-tyrosine phosphatase-like protein [Phellopilus nigrolimitatus]|nr:protein-tyrosine phosphatase-like protein [Phellopilus nigrolimitatus]